MIIGHLGVAFAARRAWRQVPLGWLVGATFAPDLWRIVLDEVKYGSWRANMYSHSLPWSAIIAVVLASMAWTTLRSGTAALLVGAVVASHIGLDALSGWKPLWIGGPHGLDLQHVEQLEFLVEVFLAWLGWRLLPAASVPRWVASRTFLMALILVQAAYSVTYYRARPPETRCIVYPFAPCWTRL